MPVHVSSLWKSMLPFFGRSPGEFSIVFLWLQISYAFMIQPSFNCQQRNTEFEWTADASQLFPNMLNNNTCLWWLAAYLKHDLQHITLGSCYFSIIILVSCVILLVGSYAVSPVGAIIYVPRYSLTLSFCHGSVHWTGWMVFHLSHDTRNGQFTLCLCCSGLTRFLLSSLV